MGPALLLSPGDVPPTPALLATVEIEPRQRWYASAQLLATLGTTSWSVPGGRLEHGAQLAGLSGGRAFWLAHRRAALRLGVGAAALRGRYRTLLASPVFVGDDGARWAAVPHVEGTLSWYPHPRVGVRGSGRLGFALPTLEYPYPTREQIVDLPVESRAARWARPLGLGAVSLEVRL